MNFLWMPWFSVFIYFQVIQVTATKTQLRFEIIRACISSRIFTWWEYRTNNLPAYSFFLKTNPKAERASFRTCSNVVSRLNWRPLSYIIFLILRQNINSKRQTSSVSLLIVCFICKRACPCCETFSRGKWTWCVWRRSTMEVMIRSSKLIKNCRLF